MNVMNEKETGSIKKATLTISAELHHQIKMYAVTNGRKLSDAVEEAIDFFLQQHK